MHGVSCLTSPTVFIPTNHACREALLSIYRVQYPHVELVEMLATNTPVTVNQFVILFVNALAVELTRGRLA